MSYWYRLYETLVIDLGSCESFPSIQVSPITYWEDSVQLILQSDFINKDIIRKKNRKTQTQNFVPGKLRIEIENYTRVKQSRG